MLAFYVFDEQSDGSARWEARLAGGCIIRWRRWGEPEKAGGRLVILRGPARMVIERLRGSSPPRRRTGTAGMTARAWRSIRTSKPTEGAGDRAESFNGALLYEPWMVKRARASQ